MEMKKLSNGDITMSLMKNGNICDEIIKTHVYTIFVLTPEGLCAYEFCGRIDGDSFPSFVSSSKLADPNNSYTSVNFPSMCDSGEEEWDVLFVKLFDSYFTDVVHLYKIAQIPTRLHLVKEHFDNTVLDRIQELLSDILAPSSGTVP